VAGIDWPESEPPRLIPFAELEDCPLTDARLVEMLTSEDWGRVAIDVPFGWPTGLLDLPFHDLRHTFGTIAIAQEGVSVYDIKVWMGHANVTTTEKYLHHRPQTAAAARLSGAFTTRPELVVDRDTTAAG
jgi:hypothetical protein